MLFSLFVTVDCQPGGKCFEPSAYSLRRVVKKKEFFTSNQKNSAFEVNRRFAYVTRSNGCGRAAAKRFVD